MCDKGERTPSAVDSWAIRITVWRTMASIKIRSFIRGLSLKKALNLHVCQSASGNESRDTDDCAFTEIFCSQWGCDKLHRVGEIVHQRSEKLLTCYATKTQVKVSWLAGVWRHFAAVVAICKSAQRGQMS